MVSVIEQCVTEIERFQAMQVSALMPDAELRVTRQQALTEYRSLGWPTRAQEQWKYANLRAVDPLALPLNQRSVPRALNSPKQWQGALLIVLVDGHFSPELSDKANVSPGVEVTCLSAMSEQNLAAYKQSVSELSDVNNAILNLNLALCGGGVMIRVAANVRDEAKIELVHLSTKAGGGTQSHVHNLIYMDSGARASLCERFVSLSEASCFHNLLTQVFLSDRAELHYHKIQSNSAHRGHRFSHTRVSLGECSRLCGSLLSASSGYCREDIEWHFKGQHADCRWNGLLMTGENSQCECYTRAVHGKAYCRSQQSIRSVLSGNANATCHNGIFVAEHAEKTDAQLQNRNLLLSQSARVNTKPELEIYNDDVVCSHGATVGCLDEDAVFYLRSRGLSEQQVRDLLLFAFVNDISQGVEDSDLALLMSNAVTCSAELLLRGEQSD